MTQIISKSGGIVDINGVNFQAMASYRPLLVQNPSTLYIDNCAQTVTSALGFLDYSTTTASSFVKISNVNVLGVTATVTATDYPFKFSGSQARTLYLILTLHLVTSTFELYNIEVVNLDTTLAVYQFHFTAYCTSISMYVYV